MINVRDNILHAVIMDDEIFNFTDLYKLMWFEMNFYVCVF
jgi:hypothetical protein